MHGFAVTLVFHSCIQQLPVGEHDPTMIAQPTNVALVLIENQVSDHVNRSLFLANT